MAFGLSMHPWIYIAKYDKGLWSDEILQQDNISSDEFEKLSDLEKKEVLSNRNNISYLPMVNCTTQYGVGCFEGIKAYPQKNGTVKLFRPDENANRMYRSMEGLMMPGLTPSLLENGIIESIRKNSKLGYLPKYNSEWEKNNFLTADAVYIRPFSYAEASIGVGISKKPWVVSICTNVSGYFKEGMQSKAFVTDKIRATKGGTGWIKSISNYAVPTLAKKKAEKDGFIEAIFLDSEEHKYVEEGSSCNIFFKLKNGSLVTPSLGETILPGITRKSVIVLAKDMGLTVDERQITIDEVMDSGTECFVTGTAAGVTHLESITYNRNEKVFNNRAIGEVTLKLQSTLKGIQYGTVEDKFNWMKSIE